MRTRHDGSGQHASTKRRHLRKLVLSRTSRFFERPLLISKVVLLKERLFSAVRAGKGLPAFGKLGLCSRPEMVGECIFDFGVYERLGTVRTAEGPTCHCRTPLTQATVR